MQLQLQRVCLRLFLIGRHDAWLGCRNRHGPGKIRVVRVQNICPTLSVPLGGEAPRAGLRPHRLHLRRKAEGQVHRLYRIDFKQHHRARPCGAVVWRKHCLPHCQPDVGVRNHRAVWIHMDGSRVRVQFNRHRVPFHLRPQREVAEQLHRQHPSLKRALLLAQHHALRTRNRKRLPCLHAALNRQASFGHMQRRKRMKSNGLGGCRGCIANYKIERERAFTHAGALLSQAIYTMFTVTMICHCIYSFMP